MERSPLTGLVTLAVVAVLAMALMWLFALNQVTDTGVAGAATAIDTTLGRSLAPGAKTRVTMVRDGTGIDATRRYVVRLRPTPAVSADAQAVSRVAERAARLVLGEIQPTKAPVFVHVEADSGAGPATRACFRRTGADGAWDLEPVVPAPPTPAPASAGDRSPPPSNGPRGDAPAEDRNR